MKTLKTILTVLSLFLLISSCSKDDDPTPVNYSEENPLQEFLTKTGFYQETMEQTATGELLAGLSFIPKVKGKINSLLVKIPAINSNLKVTIWDKTSGTLLRQEIVNVSSADTEIMKEITPLQLEKDKTYVISMQTNKAYVRYKTDQTNAPFPVTAGNIQVLSYIEGINLSTIPNANYYNLYAGDCSFKFQQTE
jgi:PBP1b-binding outer membrane lipoprotein LpoB